jgi:PEP-CTERM motif
MRLNELGCAAALAIGCTNGGGAFAAPGDPSLVAGTGQIGGMSFSALTEYVGGPNSDPVGIGAVDSNKLFYINEQQVNNTKSWYIFFDPACRSAVDATITFSSEIDVVLTGRLQLEQSTTTYRNTDVNYDFVKYTGLEKRDYIEQLDPYTLRIHWRAGDPGDHIRVLTTTVPEPQSYALMLAGLGLLAGISARQRVRRTVGLAGAATAT